MPGARDGLSRSAIVGEELAEDTGVHSEEIGLRVADYGTHYWTSHHPYVVPEPMREVPALDRVAREPSWWWRPAAGRMLPSGHGRPPPAGAKVRRTRPRRTPPPRSRGSGRTVTADAAAVVNLDRLDPPGQHPAGVLRRNSRNPLMALRYPYRVSDKSLLTQHSGDDAHRLLEIVFAVGRRRRCGGATCASAPPGTSGSGTGPDPGSSRPPPGPWRRC